MIEVSASVNEKTLIWESIPQGGKYTDLIYGTAVTPGRELFSE